MKAVIAILSTVSLLASQQAHAQAAQAATQAISGAVMVVAVSNVGAAKFSVPCTKPGGQAACVLMGLSLAQIPLALLTGSGAKKSKADLTYSGANYGGTDAANPATDLASQPTTYTLADGTTITGKDAQTANALTANGLGSIADDYEKNAKTFGTTGIQISDDAQSVKMPNGKTIPASAMNSAEGMRNAGFSNAEVSNAQSALNDLQKNSASIQSKVAALTNDVGGGGGGGLGSPGGGGGGGYGSGDGAYGAGGKLGLGGKGNKANVSGMSKKFGNDNIGVAGDDIFEMISRRYQSKDKVDSFLKN